VDGGIEDGTWISVFDVAGRIYHRIQVENRETVIDVSGLKSGLYIIKLSGDQGVISRKLIVE
jgi:hypothetical protein